MKFSNVLLVIAIVFFLIGNVFQLEYFYIVSSLLLTISLIFK